MLFVSLAVAAAATSRTICVTVLRAPLVATNTRSAVLSFVVSVFESDPPRAILFRVLGAALSGLLALQLTRADFWHALREAPLVATRANHVLRTFNVFYSAAESKLYRFSAAPPARRAPQRASMPAGQQLRTRVTATRTFVEGECVPSPALSHSSSSSHRFPQLFFVVWCVPVVDEDDADSRRHY